jgi:hypothetical protein
LRKDTCRIGHDRVIVAAPTVGLTGAAAASHSFAGLSAILPGPFSVVHGAADISTETVNNSPFVWITSAVAHQGAGVG